MAISGIGIQQILPQSGITGHGNRPPPPEPDNSSSDNVLPATPVQPPPAPGTGTIVDRRV